MVAVESIRRGDMFIDNGKVVWVATRNAQPAFDHRGQQVTSIDVQHWPDGGLATRHYPRGLEWPLENVRRAEEET
jgi:hypothetical protein